MNRKVIAVVASTLALAGAAVLLAQTADPISTEARGSYNRVKGFILKAADAMPEANYGFKPTAEIRNYGQLFTHIAESQMRTCSTLNGAMKQSDAGSKTAKTDIIAVLKASFDECDKAFEGASDAAVAQTTGTGRAMRTKIGSLYGTVAHDNEMYGVIGVYMRLKGMVPPSSEGPGR